MADTDEYFPRGGKKPTVHYFKQKGNFLGATEKGEKKKKKPAKKSETDDGYLSDETTKELDSQSYKTCAIGLTYKTVKPGVLFLGRVRSVHDTKVNVMLPGKMMGSVMACHISEAYNKILEAFVNDETSKVTELKDMFSPGQYVAVQVLEVEKDQLMLSMMPQHVNGGKKQADLHSGCLLQAAVSSVEDHGYVMDIGVPNTRAFLPNASANQEIELDTGMVTWCAVKSSDSTVITLSTSLAALQRAVAKKPRAPLLPATALEFTIDKALASGIEGRVSDTTAYIQRHHANTAKGRKPTLGQKVRARLLYVMPTSNTPFLTMRNIFETTYPDLQTEQYFKEGDIVDKALVLKITGRSIHLKLGEDSMATMSIKRVQVHEDLSDEQVIAQFYPVGSTHKVRVLCYHLADYMYSVTDQPALLTERYFTLSALTVGALVSGSVRTVSDSHLTLTIGRLTGYVPHAHMSDAGVYVDQKRPTASKLPKKKFKVGQEVNARVLAVDAAKQQLFLTLKPSLLDPDLEVLQSYQQVEVGKAYTGVIKHIRDYMLVSFFNNVVAVVPRHHVGAEPQQDLTEVFHLGQIVKCVILKVNVDDMKMVGSLIEAPFWPAKKPPRQTGKSEKIDEASNKSKKRKSDEQEYIAPKKKTKKSKESEEKEQDSDRKRHRKKKDKKQLLESDDESKKVSEESDAIETDLSEEDQTLSPQDLALIDLTDCVTIKNYKKRIVSLLKSIKAKTQRRDRVIKKITVIEEKGLDANNKKYHTAMHMEKMVLEERVKKIMAVLEIAQQKLKEFNVEDNKDYKKKKEKIKRIENELNQDITSDVGKAVEVKNEVVANRKEVQDVGELKPLLDMPSVKDFWAGTVDNLSKGQEDSSSSEEEEKDQPKKKRKKLSVAEKVAKVREEEERVREMERRAIESEHQPRSSEQFERALLANPDCSQLWIAYMAFHLQATEIEKARSVGRKALATISFREEGERLNVWLALLNCEHRFGTRESQQKTLDDATQMNDPFKVHSKLLDILVETGKQQELSTLVDLMMRKYKREATTYVLCGSACYKAGLVEKARHVMQKAITVLEKKEHVSTVVQFASLERAGGAPERAEALLERVLAAYPQRTDVCALYADMLLKAGDADRLRQLMERMTSQKLPARKMKILYKKWIEVEEKIGDKEQVESVRQRAMEFIDKAKF